MTDLTSKKALEHLWVVILAAGKGKRMNATQKNKVAYEVHGVPMITRTIAMIKKVGIEHILVVVGFAKQSVMRLLDSSIIVVEQKKRLGTGHAVKKALEKIPKTARHVLVLNGDDSFLFSNTLFHELCDLHDKHNSTITFLTLTLDDPRGLGRILRGKNGKVTGIIEEKDATENQKKIQEINAACYLFSYDFLKQNISRIPKSKVTGEYYIVSLIEMAVKENEKIETLHFNHLKWRGVNTKEELKEAEALLEK